MLPEHPRIAPESRGDLFDGTEIEEALLLHVLALSDDERASIERDDPAVRAMIERAAAATPAEILALHGRMTLSDPERQEALP
jgi:hydrogenase maturation protease